MIFTEEEKILSKTTKENRLKKENSLRKKIVETSIFAVTKIIDENIERLWMFIKDLTNYSKCSKGIFEFKNFFKGSNTWTIDNEFYLEWAGVAKLKNKVIDISDREFIKSISFEVNTDISLNYIRTITLYKISNSDKTLVKMNFSRHYDKKIWNKNISIVTGLSYYINITKDNLECYEKLSETSSDYLNSRISCIIDVPIEILWNFTTNLNNLAQFFSNPIFFENYLNTQKPNSFWKLNYIQSNKKPLFFRVFQVNKIKNSKTWSYTLETFGSYTYLDTIERQKIIITLTKINDNKTQISLTNIFINNVSRSFINNINIKKQILLCKIKNHFL